MRTTVILISMILAIGLSEAIAQGPPGGQNAEGDRGRRARGGNQLMEALDKNSDGMLDSAEIQRAPLSLRELDTNKDFKLTSDELGIRTRNRGDMSQRMLEMDANKDGQLTSDEVPDRMRAWVERMDSNGDGAVDKAEMEAFQTEARRRWEEGGGPPRGGRGGPPED